MRQIVGNLIERTIRRIAAVEADGGEEEESKERRQMRRDRAYLLEQRERLASEQQMDLRVMVKV